MIDKNNPSEQASKQVPTIVREAVEAAFECREGWRVKIAQAVRALNSIAAPTESKRILSIDTPEFGELLARHALVADASGGSEQEWKEARAALIAHIDAKLAGQPAAPVTAEPVARQLISDLVKLWDSPSIDEDEHHEELARIEGEMRKFLAAPAPQQAAPLTDAGISAALDRARNATDAHCESLPHEPSKEYSDAYFYRAIERELSAGSAASAVTATTEQDAARYRKLRNSGAIIAPSQWDDDRVKVALPGWKVTDADKQELDAYLDSRPPAMAATKEKKQ